MILIIGPGAVGTILAAHLRAAGQPVRLLVRERSLAAYQAATEMRLERVGRAPLTAAKPELVTEADLSGVKLVLVCVKFHDLDAALSLLPNPLPAGVTLVSTLNGVRALQHIRHQRPFERVIALTIMFNGQWLAPLQARLTTQAQVILGSRDPEIAAPLRGTMKLSFSEGEAAVWGKLLINLANAICALTHSTFKDVLSNPDLRAVYVAVLDEAIGLIEQAGIPYKLPTPIPHRWNRLLLLSGSPLPWWFAKIRNGIQEGAFPSMVADIEAGRLTEVDQLNGEITALAHRLHVKAPVNQRIVELIHAREGKPRDFLSPAQLRALLMA